MKWHDWLFIFFMAATAAVFYHFCGALPVSVFFWASLYVLLREYKRQSESDHETTRNRLRCLEAYIESRLLHLRLELVEDMQKMLRQTQEIKERQQEKAEEAEGKDNV